MDRQLLQQHLGLVERPAIAQHRLTRAIEHEVKDIEIPQPATFRDDRVHRIERHRHDKRHGLLGNSTMGAKPVAVYRRKIALGASRADGCAPLRDGDEIGLTVERQLETRRCRRAIQNQLDPGKARAEVPTSFLS